MVINGESDYGYGPNFKRTMEVRGGLHSLYLTNIIAAGSGNALQGRIQTLMETTMETMVKTVRPAR
jgi:hypothetical protein